MQVTCIFCNSTTDATQSAGYCDGCGRKLPSSSQLQTKRSLTRSVADYAPLDANKGGPRESLLFAAVAHLFAGGLFLVIGPTLFAKVPENFMPRVMTWALIPTLFVGSLIVTARRSPRVSIGIALVAAYAWVGTTFLLDAGFAIRWLPVQATLLAVLHYALFTTFRPVR